MSTWNVIGFGIVALILLNAVQYISDNKWLLGILFLVVPAAMHLQDMAQRKKEAQRNKEAALAAKVEVTTRGDFIRGKEIVNELGWVRVSDCSSTEEVEHKLKAEAGKKDANGLIKFHWTPRKESFVAGHGKKGNPYYQTQTVYDGEGVAVRWKERRTRKSSSAKKPISAGYTSGWVALDGNNIFGAIYGKTKDLVGSFEVFNALIKRLARSPYKAHVFWDENFISFLHALDKQSRGRGLENILIEKLQIDKGSLTISRKGQRVDDIIVPWAHAKNAAVVSGDNFSKSDTDALIISKANELRSSGLLLKPDFIAGEMIVPELTNL